MMVISAINVLAVHYSLPLPALYAVKKYPIRSTWCLKNALRAFLGRAMDRWAPAGAREGQY